jgi:hypothetical protein
MIPVQKLLSRICWDKKFGAGAFEIGYEDRFRKELVRISIDTAMNGLAATDGMDDCGKGLLKSCDGAIQLNTASPDGTTINIPLHRIRRVWRNGLLIWSREKERTIT